MDIINFLDNKGIKPIEKRTEIIEAIRVGDLTIEAIKSLYGSIDDKKMALILEAMEAITRKEANIANKEWLYFTQELITSNSNNLKREASRIVGNIAPLFPQDLETAIQKLLINTSDTGTVIRWSSAYALGKIIEMPQFANSKLFDVISELSEKEKENGVKNQYLKGLKKGKKVRK